MSGDYAESYERDFGFFRDYSREAMFLDQVLRTHGVSVTRVLDIACGPGNHVLQLARMGYRCAAGDIDPDMLAKVSVAAAKNGLTIATHPIDMRQFQFAEKFDAALNMFYSFQNVLFTPGEQIDFFRGVNALLPLGGLFVIELLPEENNLRHYPPGKVFPVHTERQEDGSLLTVTSQNHITGDRTKDVVFLYETVQPDGVIEQEEFVSPICRVWLREFAQLCDATGFKQVAAFGDCDMNVPFGEESTKLVAILRRG